VCGSPLKHFAIRSDHPADPGGGHPHPAVTEDGVGGSQFEGIHFGHAEGQPIFRPEGGLDPHAVGQLGHGVHADGFQEADGRHVDGFLQGLAQRDRTAEFPIVILRAPLHVRTVLGME